MTPLRQQMHDAMLVRGLAERTRQTYIENVARLALFYHQNPAELAPRKDLRRHHRIGYNRPRDAPHHGDDDADGGGECLRSE